MTMMSAQTPTHRPFRFGVAVEHTQSREEWLGKALRAESLGYSTFLVPDHFDKDIAPIAAMSAAAAVTTRIRIGSWVLGNDFRHPIVLAKEAATLDMLSGGRFEFGIGCGYAPADYEQTGIQYDPTAERIARLEESLAVIKAFFADEPVHFTGRYYQISGLQGLPRPVQRPHPPILVGGGGRHVLSQAARLADIVGLTAKVLPGGHGFDFSTITAEATLQKLQWIREAAGLRFDTLELNSFVVAVVVTDQRRQVAEGMAARFHLAVEDVLASPQCLVGSVDEICQDLRERRELYGLSYHTIVEPQMEAFAPVVAALSGR